jgi:hypothetical protein
MTGLNVWQSAIRADAILRSLGARYCVIGGIAYQRWGEPRVTRDVDFTIFVGFRNEKPWIAKLLAQFEARIENADEFAAMNRVLLMKDSTGVGIDVSLGCFPFEEEMIQRASDWGTPHAGKISTCSAEDLVTLKAFANRPQDWIDIERVVVRQGFRLDRNLILKSLSPLVELKEEPEILDRLHRVFREIN